MTYAVRKTYGHDLGLSCVFRQWRGTSHCRHLHGYALGFSFTFVADELDENGWVIDFGGLKVLKQYLVATFDHRLVIARDDPHAHHIMRLGQIAMDAASPILVDHTGCESFAAMAGGYAAALATEITQGRATLKTAECREHGANAAYWRPS